MRQFWSLVAAVALVGGASVARAGVVTFSFDIGDSGGQTITKTVGGITLTLTDPLPINESLGIAYFSADNDGIRLGQDFVTSFQLGVTGDTIQLTGYQVGFIGAATATSAFTMSGGSGASAGNSLQSEGSFTANGNWQLAPGQVGTFNVLGIPTSYYVQLKSLTFSFGAPPPGVPEPGTVGLALMGAGVLGVRVWRRRGPRATA